MWSKSISKIKNQSHYNSNSQWDKLSYNFLLCTQNCFRRLLFTWFENSVCFFLSLKKGDTHHFILFYGRIPTVQSYVMATNPSLDRLLPTRFETDLDLF